MLTSPQTLTLSQVYLSALTLRHFRNYETLELHPAPGLMILTGPNGAGKTNLLEAISLLTPGRGLRQAKFSEIARSGSEAGWTVAATVARQGQEHRLGTSFQPGGIQERRRVRINGDEARSQAAFSAYLSAVWLTPAMCRMFSEGNTVRRRFLDRLVYGFDPAHATRIQAYEHHMRERNRLLAESRPDPLWLMALERKMAEYSMAIAAARLDALGHLNGAAGQGEEGFPSLRLVITGQAEEALAEGLRSVDAEERLLQALAASRLPDSRAGRSSVGAHKSRFEVWFSDKEREAAHCSTGEQKILLLAILLAQVRAQTHWRGTAPLLLLDEVVAHLDRKRRMALFTALGDLGAQCWMTGTDAADFVSGDTPAQHWRVEEGRVIQGTD